MNVESFETYLLERGCVAVVLASVIVLAIYFGQSVPIFETYFGSAFLSVLIVLVFFFLSAAFLCEFGFIKKIPKRYRNSKTLVLMMVLLGFISIELYNVFVVWTQGGTYFNPLLAWNFVVNKVVNLLVVSASVGIVIFFDFPKNL